MKKNKAISSSIELIAFLLHDFSEKYFTFL